MTAVFRLVVPLLAALLPPPALAQIVELPGGGLPIRAHWLPAAAAGARGAIVALHGCGGLYRRDGSSFDRRYVEYVERMHRAGWHVLLPDSFGSRGSGPICSLAGRARMVTAEMRRADAIAAVRWLAARDEVDPRRIVLLGWSHGAMSALAAINGVRAGHAQPLAGAVLFYPGCRAQLAAPFAIEVPVLLLLGEKDDWTAPAPCLELAARVAAAQPDADLTVRVYADAVHGFDSTRPVRFRTDVKRGVDPSGVHQGGNPQARAAALDELDRFLDRLSR